MLIKNNKHITYVIISYNCKRESGENGIKFAFTSSAIVWKTGKHHFMNVSEVRKINKHVLLKCNTCAGIYMVNKNNFKLQYNYQWKLQQCKP